VPGVPDDLIEPPVLGFAGKKEIPRAAAWRISSGICGSIAMQPDT
jgi:hypothetical protein